MTETNRGGRREGAGRPIEKWHIGKPGTRWYMETANPDGSNGEVVLVEFRGVDREDGEEYIFQNPDTEQVITFFRAR